MRTRLDPDLIPPAPDLAFEDPLWRRGVRRIAGVDEAGRGALAGPVAAAALILPPSPQVSERLKGVRDSKEMTPPQRELWAAAVKDIALAWAVGFASHEEIDRLGIVPATRLAASRALEALTLPPDHILLDYLLLPESPLPQTTLIKGDSRSLSIASASVLAKVSRDTYMSEMDHAYRGYDFASNKGYATPVHRKALRRLGPCPIHRRSFAPLRLAQTAQAALFSS